MILRFYQFCTVLKCVGLVYLLLRLKFIGILVKGMYELWGEGSSYEELKDSIMRYPDDRKLPYLDSNSTFKITVDSFGKVISLQEQKELIQGLSYIPFKVSLF